MKKKDNTIGAVLLPAIEAVGEFMKGVREKKQKKDMVRFLLVIAKKYYDIRCLEDEIQKLIAVHNVPKEIVDEAKKMNNDDIAALRDALPSDDSAVEIFKSPKRDSGFNPFN